MQPQRGTTTEHLADIIEILRIGNKSGTLMVERGEGSTLEKGMIVFVAGQAVEARANQQNGSAAFNYLSTWRRCHFSFVGNTSAGGVSSSLTRMPPASQGSPTNNHTHTASGTNAAQSALTRSTQNGFNTRSEVTGPSSPHRLLRGEEALHHAENIQLPRLHRRLLLLIDGKRGIDELARLMTRDVHEVRKILEDLERAGLIRQ